MDRRSPPRSFPVPGHRLSHRFSHRLFHRPVRWLVPWLLAWGCGPAPEPASNSASTPAPTAQGPDVLLVVVDTLRADRLGCYGHDRATSPNLDRFAAGALRYERAVSQAPWTTPSSGRSPRWSRACFSETSSPVLS